MSEPIDFNKALELFDGDKELLAELMQDFTQDYPSLIEDIKISIEKGDTEKITAFAHRIKSALTQLAITQARNLAAEIEEMGQEGELNKIETVFEELNREMKRFKEFYDKFDWPKFIKAD